MTYADLADAIAQLSPEQRGKEARVFPPPQCPASEEVPVALLTTDPEPLILTGKPPGGSAAP